MVLRRKVQVLVYRHNPFLEVLLLKRARPSREDAGEEGDWQPVTGNVDAHEQIRAAAIREAWEEATVEIEPQPLGLTFTYEKKGGPRKGRFHETVFVASVPADETVELSEEHTEHAWVPVEEALKRLHWPEQRKAVEELAKRYA